MPSILVSTFGRKVGAVHRREFIAPFVFRFVSAIS
jgi:hypothetical protein